MITRYITFLICVSECGKTVKWNGAANSLIHWCFFPFIQSGRVTPLGWAILLPGPELRYGFAKYWVVVLEILSGKCHEIGKGDARGRLWLVLEL